MKVIGGAVSIILIGLIAWRPHLVVDQIKVKPACSRVLDPCARVFHGNNFPPFRLQNKGDECSRVLIIFDV